MKPGAPWSIKGIDPEAREAAKLAAAQAGMTLGEFFNHMLLEVDPASLAGGEASSGTTSRRMSATSAEPDMMGSAQAGAVRDLAEKIEKSDSQTATDISDIRQSVAELSGQIASLAGREAGAADVDPKTLEDLNYRIEESRHQSEKAIEKTQTTLSEISQRIEASISRSNEAVTTVGKAIKVMAGRLDTLENNADQSAEQNMLFGSRHEPEAESFSGEEDVQSSVDVPEEASELAAEENISTADKTPDIFESTPEFLADQQKAEPDLSSEDRVSGFDVDAYLSEQSVQPEAVPGEFMDAPADVDPVSEASGEDPDPETSAIHSSTSVDDFLNQFGEETLINRELDDGADDDMTEAVEHITVDADIPDSEHLASDLDEVTEPKNKSPQDVIEAIRQAARNTTISEDYDREDSDDQASYDVAEDEEEPLELDTVANYRSKHQKGSSRVKYAIYAACAAILLAASGLIASVKGLI